MQNTQGGSMPPRLPLPHTRGKALNFGDYGTAATESKVPPERGGAKAMRLTWQPFLAVRLAYLGFSALGYTAV